MEELKYILDESIQSYSYNVGLYESAIVMTNCGLAMAI